MVDQTLLEQIQYAVIETPDGGASWSSGLWTRDEVLGYVNHRQDQFVRDTHAIITTASIGVVAPYGTRHPLPADWMATVRVTWTSALPGAVPVELGRSDSWEADNGIPTWSGTPANPPKLYMDGDTPALTLQIAPAPSIDGTLGVSYVPTCTPLTGNGVDFDIAEEFTPTVKYGALSDMFSKIGRAQDPARAEYCTKRYQMGVEIAQTLLKGFK